MRIPFMNIEIDNMTMDEAMAAVDQKIKDRSREYVITPNVDHMVKLQNNVEFLKAYTCAGLVLVDGTPIMAVAKLYGTPLKEKIVGSRLAEHTLQLCEEKGYSIFFLGGKEGVPEKASRKALQDHPKLKVAGTYSPPLGFEKNKQESEKIVSLINEAKPDVIFACMSSPKTELFLMRYSKQMDIGIAMSLGAVIDFMAGTVKRCPRWVNRIGMEWFFRFLMEPKRMFKRYFIDDVHFISLILKYRKEKKWKSLKD